LNKCYDVIIVQKQVQDGRDTAAALSDTVGLTSEPKVSMQEAPEFESEVVPTLKEHINPELPDIPMPNLVERIVSDSARATTGSITPREEPGTPPASPNGAQQRYTPEMSPATTAAEIVSHLQEIVPQTPTSTPSAATPATQGLSPATTAAALATHLQEIIPGTKESFSTTPDQDKVSDDKADKLEGEDGVDDLVEKVSDSVADVVKQQEPPAGEAHAEEVAVRHLEELKSSNENGYALTKSSGFRDVFAAEEGSAGAAASSFEERTLAQLANKVAEEEKEGQDDQNDDLNDVEEESGGAPSSRETEEDMLVASSSSSSAEEEDASYSFLADTNNPAAPMNIGDELKQSLDKAEPDDNGGEEDSQLAYERQTTREAADIPLDSPPIKSDAAPTSFLHDDVKEKSEEEPSEKVLKAETSSKDQGDKMKDGERERADNGHHEEEGQKEH
jgi:hypothetical protein